MGTRSRRLALILVFALAALAWDRVVTAPAEPEAVTDEWPAVQGPEDLSPEAAPGRVVDAAGVLGGLAETVDWLARTWRDDLGIEVHVVTLRAPARPVEELATEIFERRRIGADAPTGGLLVLVNAARGEARIEVSYALEHVFTDALTGRVARDQLAPYAAYRAVGMAAMDALHFLKDFAFLKAASGELALDAAYRERPAYLERTRHLSGGAGAGASLEAATLVDRDFKARIPEPRRARYAASDDPAESVEAFLRTRRDLAGDPTLALFTPGSRCMRARYPFAPFEQLERLRRTERSRPLRIVVRGDRAVADSDQPAHGFVPVLLQRTDGLWRVDLVETWKNLFFDERGSYWLKTDANPYAFGLQRFRVSATGDASAHDLSPLDLGGRELAEMLGELEADEGAAAAFWLGELLYRNCWLPLEAFVHYERAAELAPTPRFLETLGDRAAYLGFHELAKSAYARLGEAGRVDLAAAQRAAGDADAALATLREALARDPFRLDALELRRSILWSRGDVADGDAVTSRIDEILTDPDRPHVPLAATFHAAEPTGADPPRAEARALSVTLSNHSARAVEVERIVATRRGAAGLRELGDVVDRWHFPAGGRRLRPGESARGDGALPVPDGPAPVGYQLSVCWNGGEARQCRDYHTDVRAD